MTASPRAGAVAFSADIPASTLMGGARVEVCIAGSALAGMIAAYFLAREKRSVMVIEEGVVGAPQVGAEMAQLAGALEVEQRLGAEGARAAAQRFCTAIDAIEAIVRRERIACEFERLDGYRLCAAQGERGDLEREVECAARTGMQEVELLDAPPIRGTSDAPCVRYPGQALLHPGKFAAGLARAMKRDGSRIHCGVHTRAVEVARVASVLTSVGHRIQADIVVTPGTAADTSANAIAHVIGLRVPRGAVTRALYWDAGGQHCARLRDQGLRGADVLLVAGRGEDASDDASQLDALEAWARRHFPCAAEVVQRFSGEMLHTPAAFAFAGRDVDDSERVYASDASCGTAMTRAATAGMAIKDFVEGTRATTAEPQQPSAVTDARRSAPAREFA